MTFTGASSAIAETTDGLTDQVEYDTQASAHGPQVLAPVLTLAEARLRVAHGQAELSLIKGQRGSAWHRPFAIETFIKKELEKPCHAVEAKYCLIVEWAKE